MAAPMKRQQPSVGEQGAEALPATPAAKRPRSRGGMGGTKRQEGAKGQPARRGSHSGGAGRRRTAPQPTPADCSPEGSAEEDDQQASAAAADNSEEQKQPSLPSKAAAAAGEEALLDQSPAPAAAAKQRNRAAAPGHSHGSMQQLADSAAEQAGGGLGSGEDGSADDGGGAAQSARSGGRPAAGAIVRGPTFRLARGEEPPCFRIWLTLQAPCSAEDVTVLCKRHYIQVTQRVGGEGRSPDGLCLPPPPPVQVHHLVLPEPLGLAEPVQALVTPRGECYIEAAIQSGRHGGSSSEGATSEG